MLYSCIHVLNAFIKEPCQLLVDSVAQGENKGSRKDMENIGLRKRQKSCIIICSHAFKDVHISAKNDAIILRIQQM